MVVASFSRSKLPSRAVSFHPVVVTASATRMALVPTAWGECGLLWRLNAGNTGEAPAFAEAPVDALLCRITVPGLPPAQLRERLRRYDPLASEVLPDHRGHFPSQLAPVWFGELAAFLQATFTDALQTAAHTPYADLWSVWRPRLDCARLTSFQLQVLDLVARIPRGEVRSYAQIARQAGKPNGARAVGAVMRMNPWPLLIPCHRVVGSSGALTGYSGPGSVQTKKRLLELEHALGRPMGLAR